MSWKSITTKPQKQVRALAKHGRLRCPKCGNSELDWRIEYLDGLISDLVDCYCYTCPDCGFRFRV